MSGVIALITANWQALAGILAAITGAFGLYLKGRRDAAQKAEVKDQTNANLIRKAGADARAGADPSGLHDDGWRRRD